MPLELEYREQDESLFICAIKQIAILLWKDWSRDMEAVESPTQNFSLRGICPHPSCGRNSAFLMVGSMHQVDTNRVVAMMQCQACLSFILAIVNRQSQMNRIIYHYQEHYPMGLPDERTPDEIPDEIKSELQEAIRCHWLRAYRACVLMCRRSLQISCDKELLEGLDHEPSEADKKQNSRKDLFTQIDELKDKGRITETLQKMAHRIRLLGKRGAYGDYSDIDATIGETDAKQALTFMRHYLDHVYVLPKQLDDKDSTTQAAKSSNA